MTTYCDASILIKRVLHEDHADEVCDDLATRAASGHRLLTSSLARAEIRRTLTRALGPGASKSIDAMTHAALAGVFVESLDDVTVDFAGRLPVRFLGTLDAIHVATALRSECSLLLTQDRQMARACDELGLAVG